MAYAILTTPTGRKSLRKLPQPIGKHLVTEMEQLQHNPLAGSQLQGYSFLRVLRTRVHATDYRIVYEVNKAAHQVIIHFVASRENFYKQLSRKNLRPT